MAIINNLNGDKVEFTGVSRVWNNTKYDFEEIYFGDKQIFSIWAEPESPLPITILSAGEDLIDYRIFGNTENGESVGERTVNLLDKDLTNIINNRKLNSTGAEAYSNGYFCVTKYIPIFAGTEYSVYNPNSSSDTFHAFYDTNKNFLTSFLAVGNNLQTATSPANAAYIRCSLLSYTRFPSAFASAMLFEGSTAPTSYIPYGYQLPMVVRSENLLDDNAPDYEVGCFYDQNNTKIANHVYAESGYIPVKAGTYLIVILASGSDRVLIANFFDTNKNFDSNLLYRIGPGHNNTLTIPSDGYVRFNIFLGTAYTNAFMFIEGSTAPTEYIPYYRDEENIYIGSDPLAEDEYVDYGEQKVYKRTSNLFDIRKVASNIVTITGDNEFQKAETEKSWYDLFDHQTSDSPTRKADTTKCLYLEAGTYTLSGTAKLPDDDYADLYYVLTAQSNGTILAATALPYTFTLAADNYITIRIGITHRVNMSQIMITAGSETPSTYESYLTPTDPPVPTPALPTIEGETIIDYNPSTTPAVEPEKMYTKYRKEGF